MREPERVYETDVLVIGGGIAGCFSAIRAREEGADVLMVDKGYAGKAGATPIASLGFMVYNPEWDMDLDACMAAVSEKGEYVNDRSWTEIIFRESLPAYEELVDWGVNFRVEDPDGAPYFKRYPPFAVVPIGVPTTAMPSRRRAEKVGVRILDKIVITDLLKEGDRVIGAVGFSLLEGDRCLFLAGATVVATGFTSVLWGNGDAIAYRVGAELTTKEYAYTWPGAGTLPEGQRAAAARTMYMRFKDAEGADIDVSSNYEMDLTMEFLIHAGRGPIFWNLDGALPEDIERMKKRQESAFPHDPVDFDPGGGGRFQMDGGDGGMNVCPQTGGIWPVDMSCATTLPGLFAAGEACGTRYIGARHPGPGFGLAGSAVTGSRAGRGAARFARENSKPVPDRGEVERLMEVLITPIERKGGFSPRWVTRVLQNTITPYFMKYIKHGERLQAGLTIVEFLNDHAVPRLFARDHHELWLAHETRNMVQSAEMILRSSLFRTESRGNHYREDFPRRDDNDWLAWVKLRESDGKMQLWKEPIPAEWRPDPARSYEERYPRRYPGE
jgi:succinate dehydrogenase/fumarate reductase flavoprotein subunit